MGRQLHLRNMAGIAWVACHRPGYDARLDFAWARLAGELSKRRWRLGRNLRDLRKSRNERNWREHRVANGLGSDGNLRLRRSGTVKHPARLTVLAELAKIGRFVERTAHHRHGIPGRLLFEIRFLSSKFPTARSCYLSELPQWPWASVGFLSLRYLIFPTGEGLMRESSSARSTSSRSEK